VLARASFFFLFRGKALLRRDGALEAGADAGRRGGVAIAATGGPPFPAAREPRYVWPWQLGRQGASQLVPDRAHGRAAGAGWCVQSRRAAPSWAEACDREQGVLEAAAAGAECPARNSFTTATTTCCAKEDGFITEVSGAEACAVAGHWQVFCEEGTSAEGVPRFV